jgi:ubiquinone/menaquinone biosynthesis C-methylase UbiE
MKRVLMPDGYLVINEMFADNLTASQTSQKMYHHLLVELDKILGINHFYTYKKTEIIDIVKKQNLYDEKIFEYLEDQSDPVNKAIIEEYSVKMDSWLKERIRKVGITRPPQLVIIGRK